MRFVDTLWSMQLWLSMLVLIAPAIFASTSTLALAKCANYYPVAFKWAVIEVSNGYLGSDLWLMTFFFVYVVWIIMSHFAPRGMMPESLCVLYTIIGIVLTMPIYLGVWTNIFQAGFTSLSGIAIFGVFILPAMISFMHSIKAAILFVCYLPWYLTFLSFFLVFLPGYSFARLWDTTWGNRTTGIDNSLNLASEYQMKNYSVGINFGLVVINVLMTVALMSLFYMGDTVQLTTMIVLFIPLLIQLMAASFFFLVVVPLRSLFARPSPPTTGASSSSITNTNTVTASPKIYQSSELHSCKIYDDNLSPKVKWGPVTAVGSVSKEV